jgi:hypothetical protein
LEDLPDHETMPDDEHETLANTFGVPTAAAHIKTIPDLVKWVKAMQTALNQLIGLEQDRAKREEEAHAEQTRLAEEALRKEEEEAADNHPLLRHIQHNHPEVFNDFMDKHFTGISEHPEHSKLPLTDRIGKALEITKIYHPKVLSGFVEGGKVPDAPVGQDHTTGEPEAPEMEGEIPGSELPVKSEGEGVAEQAPVKKTAAAMSDSELRAKAFEIRKPTPGKQIRSTVSLSNVQGGEAPTPVEKGPGGRKLTDKEIGMRLDAARRRGGDAEMEREQRALLGA